MVRNFLQNISLKNEINIYKLDKIYDKASSLAPIIKESSSTPNTVGIDAGGDMKFSVSKSHFVADLVFKMQDVEKLALSNTNTAKIKI